MTSVGNIAYRSGSRAKLSKRGSYATIRRGGASASRISVSVDRADDATDWYGRGAPGVLGIGFSGTLNQPVTDPAATMPHPAVGKKGVRRDVGIFLIVVVCMLLAALLLGDVMTLDKQQRSLKNMKVTIERQQAENETLTATLEEKANSINVGYLAAQMNMIPAKTVEVITVTLPTTQSSQVISADEDVVGSDKLAAILGQ